MEDNKPKTRAELAELLGGKLVRNDYAPEVGDVVLIDRTPDVGIKNREVRLWLGVGLFAASLFSGIAALTIGTFPELEIGDDVVSRAIVLTNQIVSFLTGAFGLAFVAPNVPNKLDA